MGEPGGLPSMGSHRVGHDWGHLAAAAAAKVYYIPIWKSEVQNRSAGLRSSWRFWGRIWLLFFSSFWIITKLCPPLMTPWTVAHQARPPAILGWWSLPPSSKPAVSVAWSSLSFSTSIVTSAFDWPCCLPLIRTFVTTLDPPRNSRIISQLKDFNTSVKSPFQCEVTYAHVPRIRTCTFWGDHYSVCHTKLLDIDSSWNPFQQSLNMPNIFKFYYITHLIMNT